ncbi:MAG TPA: T9SS type A sorting domain-containing protein [Rubricoccaceae bacterium]
MTPLTRLIGVLALSLVAALPATAQDRPPPIKAIRATTPTVPPGGTPVIVTALGVVTRAYGRQVFIQDSTAAIVVFAPPLTPLHSAVVAGAVRAGDSLQVTGRLVEFQPTSGLPGSGQLMMDNVQSGGFFLWARNVPLPLAQRITLADLVAGDPDTEEYESEIVRIEGLTIDSGGATVFAAGTSYPVRQTVGGVETVSVLHVDGPGNGTGDSELAGRPIPTGPADFEGPIDQFRSVNQMLPVRATDLVPSPGTPADPAPHAAGVGVLVLGPNPAGTSGTTARFSLDRPGPVRISLLDALGRVVALSDHAASSGDQSVWIDTSGLAPGAYIVRLDAAEPVAPVQLVVLR